MMITATRRVEWDMGHRVASHNGKCRHLHGHRYAAEVMLALPDGGTVAQGAAAGMVSDFGDVKGVLAALFVEDWDHALMLDADDPLLSALASCGVGYAVRVVPMAGAPTAEAIAREVFQRLRVHYDRRSITVVRVRVYETPNCWADASAAPEGRL